jgi:hypothetical protein
MFGILEIESVRFLVVDDHDCRFPYPLLPYVLVISSYY